MPTLFPAAKRQLFLRAASKACEDDRCKAHNHARALEKGLFRLDLQEHDHVYIVVAELPGVDKENISIRFRDNGLLDISVVQGQSDPPSANRYLIRERISSSATRSLHLLRASGYGVTAELQNGLLYIVIPKVSYHKKPDLEITIR